MKEDFLHYVWRFRHFNHQQLETTCGTTISINNKGRYNHDAGPDFLEAQLTLGDTKWAGNVEMHIRSSEWYVHGHEKDPAYQNVILHVVLEDDRPVYRNSGELIPCLVLRDRLPRRLAGTYQQLLNNAAWIPCHAHIHKVKQFTKTMWLDRLLIERLESKTTTIIEVLERNTFDWEAAFYEIIARTLGTGLNGNTFAQLVRSVPFSVLLKYRHQLLSLEALLFGQAGLLNENHFEDYPQKLWKEYKHLKNKHKLHPLSAGIWKFMRMRPANFPTIRIAQLALLLHRTEHLFSKMMAAKNAKEIENTFNISLSHYWKTHYVFDKSSTSKVKTLGNNMIQLMTINAIAPMLFLYGKRQGNESHCEQAISLLESMKPEQNKIIRSWKDLGMTAETAGESQSLLHLKKVYCEQKRCLDCGIGKEVLEG